MLALDPVRLAKRQIALDGERTQRFSHLLSHKADRMAVSPLALLRGSAPLFYEVLEAHPALTRGPAGQGWLVGDCHLENFGAFRTGTPWDKADRHGDPIVFDLNDFDEAFVGPFRLDVLRLLTSLLLGGRELGTDGRTTLDLASALLHAYSRAAFHAENANVTIPKPVAALVDKVKGRSRKELLDGRTRVVRGQRRFVTGPRYEALTPKLRGKVERAFAKFVERLPEEQRPPDDAVAIVDAAFRIAGTGSLGCLRVAVLVSGKGGPDGAWIFDMKEEDEPSSACLERPPRLPGGERVKTAIEACLARPPRMMGVTRLRGCSMFVRRLSPQEDKLDWTKLSASDLEPLARYLGALLGRAHRRGARKMPKKPWSEADHAHLLGQAIALAGMHEAMYLAYCDETRR